MNALSLTEVISILSLIIGFNALILTFYTKYVNKKLESDIEQLRKDISLIIEHKLFIPTRIASNIPEILQKFRSSAEIQNGLLTRLYRGDVFDDKKIETIQKHFLDDAFIIQKEIQSLMIYSDDEDKRESAFKQLSENYGDGNTLKEFGKMLEYETPQRKVIVNKSIETLEKRLS